MWRNLAQSGERKSPEAKDSVPLPSLNLNVKMEIVGNTVLITGGCSGIGKIMGRMCLEKRASRLIIWDIDEDAVNATVKEFSALGSVYGHKVDISSPESVDKAYEDTKDACGDVEILINCAGIITNNKTFSEQTDADIIKTIDINTKGAMFVTLRYIKDMRARGFGHICNITSSAGMLSLPKMSLYAASKWAAIGWSDSVRIELQRAKSPVHVTTIAPYFINTGMFDGIRSFFKIQNPETVARKTLRAIEHNRGYLGIPFTQHFIRLMQGIFPVRWFDFVFGDICGLYTVMDHFTGRKK